MIVKILWALNRFTLEQIMLELSHARTNKAHILNEVIGVHQVLRLRYYHTTLHLDGRIWVGFTLPFLCK